MYYPGRQKFIELATPGRRIPVFKEIALNKETPMTIIDKLSLNGRPMVLLESGKGTESLARYSFLAFEPWMTFKSKGNRVEITVGDESRVLEGHPYDLLQEVFAEHKAIIKYPGLPKFYGGALGYFSYDMGRFFEKMPTLAEDDLNLPESYFMFFDKVICFDHFEKTLKLIININIERNSCLEQLYFDAIRELEIIATAIQGQAPTFKLPQLTSELQSTFKPEANLTKEEFEAAVVKAKEYIKAGDIFQVNLSIRLGKETDISPLNQYRILREINPSPYMSYIDFGDLHVVSCSPELLVRVNEEGLAETRPIAGTRKRGKNREEDLALANELINNEKERAEHIMLVDLERNDLGRVCNYGSVEVNELMVIEEYSHVMHIVSNVRGKLHNSKTPFDLIRACFPGGTITGAPKIRSMEIIEELEPTRRGIYTGSIGFLGYGGEMEMNIVIRTLLIQNGKAYVQAGAGIVDDSIPEREYYESLKKAEVLLRTLELAEVIFGAEEEAASGKDSLS